VPVRHTSSGPVRWQAPELYFDVEWGLEDEGDEDNVSPPAATPSSLSSDIWSFACTAYEVRLCLQNGYRTISLTLNDAAFHKPFAV
jgi:serine/threonine protein kinase